MLRALSPSGRRGDVVMHHASPRDPVWEYVIDSRTAQQCLDVQGSDMCLIGHSHVPLAYTPGANGRATGGHMPPTQIKLGDGRWLLDPGSVGQTRDSDPRAAYMVLDTDSGTATWRRVDYPIERAQRAILEAGLPRRRWPRDWRTGARSRSNAATRSHLTVPGTAGVRS